MTFIIFTKEGTRETYSNKYDETIESEVDAAWEDVRSMFPDAAYIEQF